MPLKDPQKRREYHKQYMREVWYPKNQKRHLQYVKNLKIKIKVFLDQYKRNGHCTDCGYSGKDYPQVLVFDHLGHKSFQLGGWNKSVLNLERIKNEIKM